MALILSIRECQDWTGLRDLREVVTEGVCNAACALIDGVVTAHRESAKEGERPPRSVLESLRTFPSRLQLSSEGCVA